MPDAPPTAVRDVRLVLPDDWWVVPLRLARAREPARGGADGSLLVAVEGRLRPPAEPPRGFALDIARLRPGPVLRRVHEQPAPVDDGDPLPSLVADYWLERPDGAGLVQLAFATPMVEVRRAMLELFDTVTSALQWVSDPTTPG